MNKYLLKNTIKSYETDASGRVSLANLFYYFQEAANLHASHLDWGLEYLDSINKFWILSRLKLRIEKYPIHKDEIEIETWSRGAEGFFAYRDYQIRLNGQVLANAVSSWMILDNIAHRPCKIEQIGKEVPALSDSYLKFPETKIPSLEDKHFLFEKAVNYSDIDINLHVNNGKYVEILIDAIAGKTELKREIKEIDIQYLHESQIGDTLKVYSNIADPQVASGFTLSIENHTKGKETCRCAIR